ncbi:uncharacterized protein MONBRDRAFT_36113 [Monosiga brevicollis MX1]|uniref:Prefoldin subunit 4 n=1 Tax=Monosiga brevicollis TaxID=81824 RepID=A9UT52_MONBE|nr:uncharacterized protein MONBRDRAFT_36113 [Monosiga brevicollis MX1]EDQ91185.1 predicted protein [Monosiga brevicollis MX1]|eukprot:XP_001743607.1 hypothetical protein [Monosiga brevicollis MX1]
MSLSSHIVNPEDERDVPILKEDQDRINEFARLHAKQTELTDNYKASQDRAEGYNDASEELMLQDDESIPIAVGDCFFMLETDQANELLENGKEAAEAEMEGLREKVGEIDDRLVELKGVLKAKFGNSIQLD